MRRVEQFHRYDPPKGQLMARLTILAVVALIWLSWNIGTMLYKLCTRYYKLSTRKGTQYDTRSEENKPDNT